MHRIALFAEDEGHERFLQALVERLSREFGVHVDVRPYSVRGGRGKVMSELRQYLREVARAPQEAPELLIVATDCNCKGFQSRRQEIDRVTEGFNRPVILAIPQPHVERWFLIDSSAFRSVLGRGCDAPDQKCERDRYKSLFLRAIVDAGRTPLLGGLEYVADLVDAMNLDYVQRVDDSLGRLVKALRETFTAWERA